MNQQTLKESIYELFTHFRYKQFPSDEMITQWATKLQSIPDHALPDIVNTIEERDAIPRNLPKAIKEAFNSWQRQHRQTSIHYDPYDDPRFPIDKLYIATELLIEKGEDSFIDYCRSERMPQQDIERCRNKTRMIFEQAKVDEMIDSVAEPIPMIEYQGESDIFKFV